MGIIMNSAPSTHVDKYQVSAPALIAQEQRFPIRRVCSRTAQAVD